ncbi:MAG: hypothetical protein JWM11_6727 [Planctomycetaceae bacterium]|nr:hypothetical protein [Planctomycetaceae bacterium]
METAPEITLRIPGDWSSFEELEERLPNGYQLRPEGLLLPDGSQFELSAMQPDRQFATIFQSACRKPPSESELAVVRRYRVKIGLMAPGGSLESALRAMQAGAAFVQAGAAFVQAGAAGVFIDNSALAHGGSDWIKMTADGGSDAISFAFVSIYHNPREFWTMGMHVLGYPDLRMSSADIDDRGETVVETIRYICRGDRQVDVGHTLADEYGPRFQVVAKLDGEFDATSPMHNPYGQLKIISAKDIADGN